MGVGGIEPTRTFHCKRPNHVLDFTCGVLAGIFILLEVPAMNKCSVEGCFGDSWSRTVCQMHYMRMYRSGEIDHGSRARGSVHERVKAHFIAGSRKECWQWLGDKNANGYGRISLGAKGAGSVLAHRIVWEAHNKASIPAGMVVMHTCDTPSCVNPRHLKLGTQADNMRDMYAKDRGYGGFSVAPIRGANHHSAKFTEAQVREIRASTENSTLMAKRLRVNRASIVKIRSRKTWKHLD